MVIRGLLLSMQEEKNQLISSVHLYKFRTGRVWSSGGFQGSNENGFYLFFFLSLDLEFSIILSLLSSQSWNHSVIGSVTGLPNIIVPFLRCSSAPVMSGLTVWFALVKASWVEVTCATSENKLQGPVSQMKAVPAAWVSDWTAWDGAVVELRVTCDVNENDILMLVSACDVGVVCYCSKSYLRLIDTQSQLKEFPDYQIS